ncbi:hypothetical protein BGX23_000950 [Mortierella sp. AD031]|nr:hypothetical protein BGX23_000950 [Mortierella sp. AD031]
MAKAPKASGSGAPSPAASRSSHSRTPANFTIDIPVPTSRQPQPTSPYPPNRPSRIPGSTSTPPRNQRPSLSSSQRQPTSMNGQRPSPTVASGSRYSISRTPMVSTATAASSSRNLTLPLRRLNRLVNSERESLGSQHQNATEIAGQQSSIPTQTASPPLTDILAGVGSVEAMLASMASNSRDNDERIRLLHAQGANFHSGLRPPATLSTPSTSSSRATLSPATQQTLSTSMAININKPCSSGSPRKKASAETVALSHAFHDDTHVRAQSNMFEKLPTEVVCAILAWVVEPSNDKMTASDDGDGARAGNPLLYWYSDPDRTLLRLVCRSWNQTILAMAREIHVRLGTDESMANFLDDEERLRTSPTPSTRATTLPERIRGGQHSHMVLTARNAVNSSPSQSQLPRPLRQLQRQQPQQSNLRRSARLSQALPPTTSPTTPSSSLSSPTTTASRSQTSSAGWGPTTSSILARQTRVSRGFGRILGLGESYGIHSDRHPRLFQHIVQEQCERRRLIKQTSVPIQGFYQLPSPRLSATAAGATTSTTGSTSSSHHGGDASTTSNPWWFPPSVSSLSVQGDQSRSSDPKEDVTLSANFSGTDPRPGGGSFDTTSKPPQYRISDPRYGTILDHLLRAAAPNGLVRFAISRSVDFSLNGLLSLPQTLTTLKISRCPRINGGALQLGFQHLPNLTSLTVCSDLLFTDEIFLIALRSLSRLTHLVYIFPCDAVQPAWRDLFRYCSSCELYHRRITTKTYIRTLLMPELPDQIQDFSFEMDEPRFQEARIETYEQNRHGLDRRDMTKFSVSLWKSADAVAGEGNKAAWCGFDLAQSEIRSWWPASLTRLDLSKSIVTGSTFDVPPQLQELVISYPLEPNEITATDGAGSDLSAEEKQWYPTTLSTLEIHGIPYHVPCVLQDEPLAKVDAWMTYTNKMLTMVPQSLETLTVNSFQVPEAESMAKMRERVQDSLKTLKVRLLCPQRPRQSGFTVHQLYAPYINVEDDSDDDEYEEVEEEEIILSSDDDTDSDSSMDIVERFIRRGQRRATRQRRQQQQQAQRQARSTLGQSRPSGQAGRQGTQTADGESSVSEQYDVTPVMLRKVVKNMKVLESLEVHVNFQHYRFCCANWKGNLSLSEPAPIMALPTLRPNSNTNEDGDDEQAEDADGAEYPRKKLKSILKRSGGLEIGGAASRELSGNGLPVDRKGKGRAHEDVKGKGRNADFYTQQEDAQEDGERDVTSTIGDQDKGKGVKRPRDDELNTLLLASDIGPVGGGGGGILTGGRRPKTSIHYWNNSCCGERCLGWTNRLHHD